MEIKIKVNGREYSAAVAEEIMLLDILRLWGFSSVRRGCDTSNCGICTVWLNKKAVLSCSVPAIRANGMEVTTLEGVKEEAEEFASLLASEGGEQCGFCNPGLIMNVLALKREIPNAGREEAKEYLAGNLCRCSGYMSQMRALEKYLGQNWGEEE